MLQNTLYNYQLHERERIKAEKDKAYLQKWIIGFVFISLLMISIILLLKYLRKSDLLKLHEALDNLSILRQSINAGLSNSGEENMQSESGIIETRKELRKSGRTPDVHELRDRLISELEKLQNDNNLHTEISNIILYSDAYVKLQDYIRKEKVISETNPLWDELENVVISSSKDFKYHIQLMSGGKLNGKDYHLALLIKCGVTPTQLSLLLGRTKGTISYRRESLCLKIFGSKLGAKTTDELIRLL